MVKISVKVYSTFVSPPIFFYYFPISEFCKSFITELVVGYHQFTHPLNTFRLTVSNRMVSLCMCGSHNKAQRKMVRQTSDEMSRNFGIHHRFELLMEKNLYFNVRFSFSRFCPRCTQDRKKK